MEDRLPATWRGPHADVPCVHDLVAWLPADDRQFPHQLSNSESATYRAFEVWPGNFESTCQLLHDKDWLNDGVCPLVLSHFLLSDADAAILPRYVPWLRLTATVEEELDALRKLLIDPLQVRGLICVDFADYAVALSHGGEVDMWHANGTTVVEATSDVLRQASSSTSILARTTACCLSIRVPRRITMEDLDQAILAVDSLLPEQSLLVASVLLGMDERCDFEISLLSVSGRL